MKEFRETLVVRCCWCKQYSNMWYFLGKFSFVGAGSTVTKDVANYALVVGVPARQVGWMSEYGCRLDLPEGRQCYMYWIPGQNTVLKARLYENLKVTLSG